MHPHTLFLADKTLTILVQWCVAAGFCAAELVIASVIDQKANATLTELNLYGNEVGDAGAAALADALQAKVFKCKKCVFRACVRCHRKCRFTKSSAALPSSTCCAACVAAFVIFGGLKRKVLFMSVCARVVLKLMWHRVRIDLHQLTSELKRFLFAIGTCLVAVCHHITSSGEWWHLEKYNVLWFDSMTWRSSHGTTPRGNKRDYKTHTPVCCGRTEGDTTARTMTDRVTRTGKWENKPVAF